MKMTDKGPIWGESLRESFENERKKEKINVGNARLRLNDGSANLERRKR